MTDNIPGSERKRIQRLTALKSRRELSPEYRRYCEQTVCQHLCQMPELRSAEVILSYLAVADELSLCVFHDWAEREGKTIAFPVSCPDGILKAYVPCGDDSMRKGKYGITEPDPLKSLQISPREIDAVIVPCVAFDKEKRRIGHGAGYYDRFLPQCMKACKIAVAFEAQRLSRIATDDLDVTMDAVVTEKDIYA